MIRTAVTISLVPAARGGPFVFWDDLETSMRQAAELGFDAVELFLPGPQAVSTEQVQKLLQTYRLQLAAVGTGAGMVLHQLSLTDRDDARRQQALAFVRSMIDWGGTFQAPAIIGSMQGRWTADEGKEPVLQRLAQALEELGKHAARYGVPLIYEPLNRYETNLCQTQAEGGQLIESYRLHNVVLLADLFHMNIEESDVAAALRAAGRHVGHVHFVDSNRRPAGCGHLEFGPIVQALRDIGYSGYVSAEALPWPDPVSAARQTMETYRQVFAAG
jgi:sugar phosphate isomerase/epimerase